MLCPAPASPTICQSHAVAEQSVSNPWSVYQTYWPPNTMCPMLVASHVNGEMNRGFGSHGSDPYRNGEHGGLTPVQAWIELRSLGVFAGAYPPLVVFHRSPYVYSEIERSPRSGPPSSCPPSPPNGLTISESPEASNDTPLSCMPPHTIGPDPMSGLAGCAGAFPAGPPYDLARGAGGVAGC